MYNRVTLSESLPGTPEKQQFYIARLREEGCEVELRGENGNETVSRVVIPHPGMSDEKKATIFRLVLGLSIVNHEQEVGPEVLRPVYCQV